MKLSGYGDDRKLGTVIQFESITSLIVPGQRLSSIEERSIESLHSSLSASSSEKLCLDKKFSNIFSGDKNLSPNENSVIRKKIFYFIRKKQSEIFDHNDNIAHFEILKNKKKAAEGERKKCNDDYLKAKIDLNRYRKKRGSLEKLGDRQQYIDHLGSKKDVVSKARFLFAKKLTLEDQKILSGQKEIKHVLNKNIPAKEKKLLAKNTAFIANEVLITTRRNDMADLKKTINATAADLYTQVVHIEKQNRGLFKDGEVMTNLKIKNGKYLLIPLLKTGQFSSVGTQLAYQGRRLVRKTSAVSDPQAAARSSGWPLNDRLEI